MEVIKDIFILIFFLVFLVLLMPFYLVSSPLPVNTGDWVRVIDTTPSAGSGYACTLVVRESYFGAPLPSFMIHGSNGCESDISISLSLTIINIIFYFAFYKFLSSKFKHFRISRTPIRRILIVFLGSTILGGIISIIISTINPGPVF
jgi:hypothetical protein